MHGRVAVTSSSAATTFVSGASPTDSVIVQEGDDFVINAKYLDYSFLDTWGIWWDTQQRDGTATEDVDYEPEHSEYHQKTSANNMNHTFHTIDDDLFEGVEYYWAGFDRARPHLYTDGEYCLVTIIDNDQLEIRESRFSSTPVDGSTYRAGETIEITVKYNGKVAIGWKTDPVYIPLAIGDENAGHVRRAEYLRGAESNSLVFGYTVQPDDFDDNDWIVPAGDKNIAASRRERRRSRGVHLRGWDQRDALHQERSSLRSPGCVVLPPRGRKALRQEHRRLPRPLPTGPHTWRRRP